MILKSKDKIWLLNIQNCGKIAVSSVVISLYWQRVDKFFSFEEFHLAFTLCLVLIEGNILQHVKFSSFINEVLRVLWSHNFVNRFRFGIRFNSAAYPFHILFGRIRAFGC